MRTLLVDATSLTVNPKGVGKYAYEVITRLTTLLPDAWKIVLIVFREELPELKWSDRLSRIEIAPQPDLKLGLWSVPTLIRETGADVMLRLCDNVGNGYPIPMLTVCHDLNELIGKAQGVKESYGIKRIVRGVKEHFRIKALRLSGMVVCNSYFTRRECISQYGLDSEKTAVAYCGIGEHFYKVDKAEAKTRTKKTYGCESYVLCFATGDPRENYRIIPEIIVATKKLSPRVFFVIGGIREGHEYVKELNQQLTQLSLAPGKDFQFVPFLGGGERSKLCDLYAAADIYLELSLHEGFGMQLAEAMACGTTCLAPSHSALGEVGGPFTLHIDPSSPVEIAEKISQCYCNQCYARDNSEQIAYTRRFSWDETASAIAQHLVGLGKPI